MRVLCACRGRQLSEEHLAEVRKTLPEIEEDLARHEYVNPVCPLPIA